nr:thermonuclease family protein [uncultured Cohaesibacter sp.]
MKYALLALFLFTNVAAAQSTPVMKKCGSNRYNCVVDGDTIWLKGVKYRMKDYDTPEPQTNVCGGDFEKQLAAKASKRLIELLNGNDWKIVTTGKQGYYKRELASIIISGEDVGDILIRERLARRWPDGDEWWCNR